MCFAWFGLSRIFARKKEDQIKMSTINQFSVSFQCAAGHDEFDWGEKSVRILRWSQFFCACAQFFPLSIHRHLWLVHVYILKTCCYAIPLVFIEKIFMNYFICLITFRSSTQFDYMPQYFECFTCCTEPRKKSISMRISE